MVRLVVVCTCGGRQEGFPKIEGLGRENFGCSDATSSPAAISCQSLINHSNPYWVGTSTVCIHQPWRQVNNLPEFYLSVFVERKLCGTRGHEDKSYYTCGWKEHGMVQAEENRLVDTGEP